MKLDDAYANVPYIPDGESYPPRWAAEAATFREARAQAHDALGVAYGDTPRQAYDIFRPETDQNGTLIFVHGGYWLRFDRSYWSHFATGALARGWSVAMPSYDLCPDVRIADITTQIARAVETIAAAEPGPLALAGHSAGGHLVSRMAQPGLLPGDVTDRITTITPISPVSDLRPLLQTSMNDQFQLTEATAAAESPALMTDRLAIPTHIWVGAEERPVFLDQARWQADAWSCPLRIDAGRHHFDIIDALKGPDSPLMQDILG
ncbi:MULTISPECIES: alpha/beta hydrolase [unclassified Roseovarius]|uniref:alpha/beta hydrolase n=1 Tax=unclassified Roseovarius TaxID=2614913 RepID=UPI00273F9C87|nr:alpha/beta hydrolase [Roseovarius sp. MMSF_3350]